MFVRQKNFVFVFTLLATCKSQNNERQPHIIFILADDLGFNDVSFHGSNQIPTPNIDALAYSGLILNNYYVTPICTPSRSALMTGKYPIHTGMQHTVLFAAEPRGLPLTEKLLPEYLKDLGYATHIVGKWHLGSFKKEYTPLYRGFDSHFGFWTGRIDYYDHTSMEQNTWGLDMRRGMDAAWDVHGEYCTDLFTKEAVKVIKAHNVSRPMFLYVAHSAVHSGNPYSPLPVPDETVAKFSHVDDYNRRKFAGMMSKLDDSVGAIVESLNNAGMLSNSVVIFSTDNGGPADGFNFNAASNWPLRGVKNTLWEGGVRGAGLIFSPLLQKSSRVANQFMHISDWLPTLYSAAGGNVGDLAKIDGINLWHALSADGPSKRTEILHNIDDIYGNAAITEGDWKLIKGTTYGGAWDSWYGPSGREGTYNTTDIATSPAGKSLVAIKKLPSPEKISQLRSQADVKCTKSSGEKIACKPLVAACLFNIAEDPCEQRNVAKEFPDMVKKLEAILAKWNASAVPPGNLPMDPRADPRFWDHTWTNFGDFSIRFLTNSVN